MRPRLPLPQVLDLDVQVCPERMSCKLEVFTAAEPTPDDAESLRRAVAPTLSQTFRKVQLRVRGDLAAVVSEGTAHLDHAEALIRMVLATVISVAHRPRLLHYAKRCAHSGERESMLDAEDLVEDALTLLLAGKLSWRGSLEQMLGSLCGAIRNLSLDRHRAHAKLESFDPSEPYSGATTHDPDRAAFRVLLHADAQVALEALPESQRTAVVACWMNGEPAASFAATEGRLPATVRVQLHRAAPALRWALRSYGSSPLSSGPVSTCNVFGASGNY